jgi:selenocysteine lyase/cysteine desulfurase
MADALRIMNRRTFIHGTAAALAAAGFLPRVTRGAAGGLEALRRELAGAGDGGRFWGRVRREFLLAPGLIHLNCGSAGATPRLVVDAVAGYLRELESDPVHQLYGPMGQAMEAVRRHAAGFLGADESEVSITRNTTEGMNLIAAGLRLEAGDEVLTTTHEHPGGMSCWQYLAERDGVRVVQVALPAPPKDKAEILQRVADAITPRTRVCSFSHVTMPTGLQMPIREIAAIVRSKGLLLVVDGAQAPGMLPVDVKALGADAYASSSHKWLLAPKGSGLLYVRREAQDRIKPVSLRAGNAVYSSSSGTQNAPHVLGHGLALDFIEAIGRERVAARCRELQLRLRARLEKIAGLRVLTPSDPELSSAMLSVALEKGRNSDVAERLRKEHKVVVKAVPPTLAVAAGMAAEDYNALRFSTHIFNTEDEVDAAAEALGRVCREG